MKLLGWIEAAGFLVSGITPAEFSRYIDRELKKWGTVIRAASITAE